MLNKSAFFLSSAFIREKLYGSKSLSFLLWPNLEGSRHDLKGSTRIPLDSERPKNSFSLYPTALSQLGRNGGWGNSMCGRGLQQKKNNNNNNGACKRSHLSNVKSSCIIWPLSRICNNCQCEPRICTDICLPYYVFVCVSYINHQFQFCASLGITLTSNSTSRDETEF